MARRRKAATIDQQRTIGYVRVSTEDQRTNGCSLDAQKARIAAFALATGRELDEVVIDAGQSAKSLARPGIACVLEGVKSGEIGTVIVLKLDRLTRSVRDLSDLLDLFAKKGAALVSVGESLDTASAAGRLVLNMLATVAQWERESCSERTGFALAHKRAKGKAYSRTPFGYRRVDDHLEPDEMQQQGLKLIRKMSGEGCTLRAIGAELTRLGVAPVRGGEWSTSSIQSILGSRMFQETAA